MNKKVPVWLVLLFLWLWFIITILFGWAVWHVETVNRNIDNNKSRVILFLASFPHLVKESFVEIKRPARLVRTNLYPYINGLKIEKKQVDSGYILLSTYDDRLAQSFVKLLRLSDQKTIFKWVPDFENLKKEQKRDNNYWKNSEVNSLRIFHPLLFPDGSIVFNTLISPLVKIDKNSLVAWTIPGKFHHSQELDGDGNIWAPSVTAHSKLLPEFLGNYQEDAITKISPAGKLLFKKSIVEILFENGYRALILGVGAFESDFSHLNDIQPALTSGRYWVKGDLLISLRHRSTVFLYRPSTNKILWLKTGPWLNQHDVDFIDSSRIGIFGNNIVRYGHNIQIPSLAKPVDEHNEEYIYDFNTGLIETPYTDFFKKAKIMTESEGRSDILPNGDIFIEETNNNRLLRGNKKEIIWQYVDRIDKDHVATLSWSRFITYNEFKKLTFLKKK